MSLYYINRWRISFYFRLDIWVGYRLKKGWVDLVKKLKFVSLYCVSKAHGNNDIQGKVHLSYKGGIIAERKIIVLFYCFYIIYFIIAPINSPPLPQGPYCSQSKLPLPQNITHQNRKLMPLSTYQFLMKQVQIYNENCIQILPILFFLPFLLFFLEWDLINDLSVNLPNLYCAQSQFCQADTIWLSIADIDLIFPSALFSTNSQSCPFLMTSFNWTKGQLFFFFITDKLLRIQYVPPFESN